MKELGKLLEEAGSGDSQAFELVVRDQLGRLYGIALRVAGDSGIAEDVVQEAFLRVLSGRTPCRDGNKAAAWLARVTVRLALDRLREETARRRREERFAMARESPGSGREAEERLIRGEEAEALSRGLASLPAETRACVWLHFAEGFGVREVAASIGRGKSATAERIRTGAARLREELGKRGLALSATPLSGLLERLPRLQPTEDLERKVQEIGAAARGRGRAGGPRWHLGAGVGGMDGMRITLMVAMAAVLAAGGWVVISKVREPAGKGEVVQLPSRPPRAISPSARVREIPPDAPRPGLPSSEGRVRGPGDGRRPAGLQILSGRVLDREEQPIAGASLEVRKADGSAELKGEVATDEEGGFQLDGLDAGKYSVLAQDWCHAPSGAEVELPAAGEVLLRLERAAAIVAMLFGTGGGPLREADVEVYRRESRHPAGAGLPAQFRTDGSGRLFLGPYYGPFLEDTTFTFQHGSFSAETVRLALEPEMLAEVQVNFKPGVTVMGSLRNLEGLPIAGADLHWSRPEEDGEVESLWCKTDERGAFRRDGLLPGSVEVGVGGQLFAEKLKPPVVLGSEAVQEVPLAVDCIPSIAVRVEDGEGKPIAGAQVFVMARTKMKGVSMVIASHLRPTAEDGTMNLEVIAPGAELDLSLDDPKLGSARARHVVKAPGETVVLRLDAARPLVGEVHEAGGEPVSAARVVAWTVKGLSHEERGATDPSGRFSLGVPPNTYRVEASGGLRGAASAGEVTVEAGKSPGRLFLVLKTAGAILVRAIGPGERPMADVAVAIERGRFSHRAFTDEDGWAALAAGEGACEVSVRPPAGFLVNLRPMEARAGGPPLEVRLDIDQARAVSGKVVLDGQPVSFARVSYWSPQVGWMGGPEGLGTCDREGSFRLERVRGKEAFLLAWGPGFAMACSDLIALPDEKDLAGVVVPALTGNDLQAKVVDGAGKPMPGLQVWLAADVEPPFQASQKTDGEGVLRIPRLPPGRYRFVNGTFAEASFDWPREGSMTLVYRER